YQSFENYKSAFSSLSIHRKSKYEGGHLDCNIVAAPPKPVTVGNSVKRKRLISNVEKSKKRAKGAASRAAGRCGSDGKNGKLGLDGSTTTSCLAYNPPPSVSTKPRSCNFCSSQDHATNKSCHHMKGWGRRYYDKADKQQLAQELTDIAKRCDVALLQNFSQDERTNVLQVIPHKGGDRAYHLVLHSFHKPFQVHDTACIKVTLLGSSGRPMENMASVHVSVSAVAAYINDLFSTQFILLKEICIDGRT
ncbi:MAG: hypothetical protein ACRDL7_09915, partial [Gaiellaceae bacterium]